MAKTTAVKWGLGSEEPEDLQDFLSNEDLEHRNGGLPTKGTYSLAVRQIRIGKIKSGDNAGKPRLSVMLVVAEPKGSPKAKWNGYLVWDGLNVMPSGLPFVKRFMRALGLEWDDFNSRTKQDSQDPPHITQIGRVKFEQGKDPVVRASLYVENTDNGEQVQVGRYLPADESADDAADREADEDEDDGVVLDEDEEPEDDEEDDEEAELREELEDLSDKKLVKRALANDGDLDKDELSDMDTDDLIDLIVEQELGEDEDDEDEDEDEDEPDEDAVEELTEELNGLKIAALRKRALRNDEDADLDGLKKADLVQLILEQELNVPPF